MTHRRGSTASASSFPFAFADSYRVAALLFGITPNRTLLTLTEQNLVVRFGPWHVHTTLSNVAGAAVTGPYRWIKTAGPARLAITDRGLTFATNGDHGVEITFRDPIAGLEPTGRLRHPTLTVTVADYRTLSTVLAKRKRL